MRSSLFIVLLFSSSVLGRPYILFANRQDIRLLEITDNKRKTNTNIIVKNLEDAAALDYFLEKNIVCWSEINREVIRCADIDPRAKGKVAKTDVVTTGLIKPEGLACDWLGMKIYWTDADTKRIEVTGLSGEKDDRAVLVWEDLDLPRAISLAPHDGLMFWTDWGEYPRIERCGMNGDPETRQILVDKDLGWPNGLTLDYSTKRLYWLEAKLAYIASVDWNGSNRKTILVGDGQTLPQPFAMTVFGDVLYWTDWDTKSLNMYNQSTEVLEKLKIRGKLNPMDIRVFEPKKQPKGSTATPCSIDNGQCSHLCLAAPYNPGYSCHCPTGIKLVNATHCAKKNSAILLLAARDNIRKVSLDTPDFTDSVIPLTGVINSIAIDYDPVSEKVFWTDDQVRAIRAANLDGSDEKSVITEEVSHPDGVAVDWVSGQLFWTDTGTDRIEVAKLNGSSRRVVISEDLDEPRGIVLDLINGWMYWSDWGKHPRIERAWMDGRSRKIIIDTGLVWPNGIAIDVERQKLYWCDAKKDRIETSNVDGTGRVPVLDEMVPHPFGFSLLGEHLYWTDWQDRSIERADKYNGKKRKVLVSHLDDLMGVKAVLASPNPNITNACATKACSHLCLITPAGAICACPNGYELTQDDLTCVVPEAFILYTQEDHIRRISLDSRNRNNYVIPVKDVQEANALDFDKTDGRIYWSDIQKKTISRSFLNGSNFEIVVQFGLEFPEGLSVDWLAGNLYWSDTGSNRIEVSRLDGTHRRVLLWRDINSPKSIAVDPIGGMIYWSSWGKDPVIESCSLDGSGRSIFMNDVSKATGLTIDYARNKLYWAEQGKGAIMSSSLSSPSSLEAVISSSVKPHGLIVYESWLYWIDWTSESIERISLESPKTTRTVVQSDMENVKDLVVYHKQKLSKDETNPCYLNERDCGGLCLAKKSNSNSQLTAQCGCPSHFTIKEDGVSCQGPKSFLLFSQKNKISRLLLDPHLPDEVPNIVLPVKRARSIHALDFDPAERIIYWVDLGAVRSEGRPGRQIIRRSKESGDSDKLGVFAKMEKFPPFDLVVDPFTRTLYWTSANTNAINVTRLDPEELSPIGPLMVGGINDKPRLLALHAEKQLLVVTMSGGVEEGGARMEVFNLHTHLREVIVNTSLGEITAVTVDSGEDKVYWMDIIMRRMEVCGMDGSERKVMISEGIVEPVGLAVQGQWIYWADRDQATIVRINKETGASRQVILNKIPHLSSIIAVNYISQSIITSHPCHSSKCSHFCSSSGTSHSCSCPPGLVLSTDLLTCTNPPTCKPDEFTCGGPGARSGPACIPLQWRCDGQSECGDSSDEMDCPECGPAQFRCQDGGCIPGARLCDGIAQCADRTDELMCCGKEEFQCGVTGNCIGNNKVCDGHHVCSDASDELQPSCNLENNLPPTGSITVIANTSTYLIAIFAGMISMLVLGLSVYCCKRWYLGRRIYVSRPPELTETIPPQQTEMLTGPSLTLNGQKDVREGGQEPPLSLMGSSANGQLYERGHVTGASSNTGSSNTGGHYHPAVHPGPPPSPATSVVTRLSSLIPRANRTQHHASSHNSSAFNVGVPSGYQYYSPRAHPCTPCSTDVADSDVADSVAYSALTVPHYRPHFTSRAASLAPSRNGYESEGPDADQLEMRGTRSRYVAPPSSYVGAPPSYVGAPPSYVGAPPSTPFYLSEFEDPETSCPPSPVTERSFFINPYLPGPRGPVGPPPSPVPSRSPIDSPTINHLHPHK